MFFEDIKRLKTIIYMIGPIRCLGDGVRAESKNLLVYQAEIFKSAFEIMSGNNKLSFAAIG